MEMLWVRVGIYIFLSTAYSFYRFSVHYTLTDEVSSPFCAADFREQIAPSGEKLRRLAVM